MNAHKELKDTEMAEQQIAVHDQQETAPVPASESAAIFSLIERAARDPNIDIDKMERLMAMQERMLERNAKSAYMAALAEMQPELPVITERGGIKNKVGEVQSTYAKWEDINEAIKPILAKYGFSLSFKVNRTDGMVSVTGILGHREGHSEQTSIDLPVDGSGSKNAVQAVGSSTSYGQRYTAKALLNITSRGEDDDGKKAGDGETISEEQAAEIRALIDRTETDIAKFCNYFKVDAIPDLSVRQFDRAISSLKSKLKGDGNAAAQ